MLLITRQLLGIKVTISFTHMKVGTCSPKNMAKSWLVAFVALTFTASVLAFDFPEPPNYPWVRSKRVLLNNYLDHYIFSFALIADN